MHGNWISVRRALCACPLFAFLIWVALLPQPMHALGTSHPSFTFKNILPVEMNAVLGLGGIDFLPNGDGVICIWGGSQKSIGELWVVSNLASGTPGPATRIASGLREPLGVKVVGKDIYLIEKPGIVKYVGSGIAWTRSNFFSLPQAWYDDKQWHHFSFGLEMRDSALWFTTGTAYEYSPDDPIQRGALIKVPLNGDSYTQYARGMSNPDGLGMGPDQQFFATDNQWYYKPANVLFHLPTQNIPQDGRFYGSRTRRNNTCGITPQTVGKEVCPEDPEYPPAIWIPYGSISYSPLRPVLLKKGPYAGQMISGDVYRGGILRYFLERVNGEYQGSVFPFMNGGSNGIPYGIHQFLHTSLGDLIGIGIGNGCAGQGGEYIWSFKGSCRGMHLFSYTDQTPFEMKAIRSTSTGFQIEFTQPASAEAGLVANYKVQTTVFTPVQSYGADAATNDNNISIEITDVRLSDDGLFAEIKLSSLETRRMYAITLNGITSQKGEMPNANVAYYTLNQVALPVRAIAKNAGNADGNSFGQIMRWDANSRRMTLTSQSPYQLTLKTMDGRRVMQMTGPKSQTYSLATLEAGIYVLTGRIEGAMHSQRLVLP